jgi:murein tripeptide amidase MpaA
MLKCLLAGVVLASGLSAPARSEAAPSPMTPEARRTPAEASDYTRTPRYDETMAWLRDVVGDHPWVRIRDFGTSAQGRALPLVVIASDGEFTPEAALASGKEIVLIQAAIHPGENEGKDVLMALVRDLVVHGRHQDALDHLILLLIPIFNVDGHERFGPYNRINQNGPEAMGWRATAQNLNLNRDFIKADAPEMRAWLRLFHSWQPDLLVDMHNTNGADYQYEMTWAWERAPTIHPQLEDWQREVFAGRVQPALEARGWKLFPYFSMVDGTDLRRGITHGASNPRFSVGYAAVANRAGILLETHMLKDFRTRVAVNTDLLTEMLKAMAARPGALRRAVRAAEAATTARPRETKVEVPVAYGLAETTREVDFLGYDDTRSASEISGAIQVQYHPDRPLRFKVPMRDELTVTASASVPAGWLVPAEWSGVIERLALHGIESRQLDRPATVEGETTRFDGVEWAPRPFEGRHSITKLEGRVVRETLEVAPGSVLVPAAQANGGLALHLLEPAAPDSLIRWGFFDAIFEEKEYAEPRVMEAMARDLLAKDPALKVAFMEKLRDPAFAGDARARLRFFYERTPYFDQALNRYPVLRLDAATFERLSREQPPAATPGASTGAQPKPR